MSIITEPSITSAEPQPMPSAVHAAHSRRDSAPAHSESRKVRATPPPPLAESNSESAFTAAPTSADMIHSGARPPKKAQNAPHASAPPSAARTAPPL